MQKVYNLSQFSPIGQVLPYYLPTSDREPGSNNREAKVVREGIGHVRYDNGVQEWNTSLKCTSPCTKRTKA